MAGARVEFTVEPFEVGALGPHVRAALAAAEAFGGPVDVGPFASSVEVPREVAARVVHDVVHAALATGATRVAVQVELEGTGS
jgi:uncharacterized protein YqgV (UPF0045/DUF77 family)